MNQKTWKYFKSLFGYTLFHQVLRENIKNEPKDTLYNNALNNALTTLRSYKVLSKIDS